jgi:AcrR family transcriptional regulator
LAKSFLTEICLVAETTHLYTDGYTSADLSQGAPRLTHNERRGAQFGRPREFDWNEALDSAMLVFWRKGYDGASLADLTEALGIARPSLYAAFGNKERLFEKVLDRYDRKTAGFLAGSLRALTAREAVEGMLRGAANFHADQANPPGCLMVHGALVGPDESAPLRQETRARRASLTEAIRERLERALSEGDLPPESNPRALALYVVAVMRGMAVEAASGASGEELHGIADLTMGAWPVRQQSSRRHQRQHDG